MALNCEQCYAAITSTDRFCPNCGASVSPVQSVTKDSSASQLCCVCAKRIYIGDRFCSACGAMQTHVAPQSSAQAASSYCSRPSANVCACCGESVPTTNRFCIGCGASVGAASSTARPSHPGTATGSVPPNRPPYAAKPQNTTRQTPIQVGNAYHCPKCNAALTSGLKICSACEVSFLDPIPYVRTSAQPAPSRSSGVAGWLGALTVLLVIVFAVYGLLGRGKGMSGVYTDELGISTITFSNNGNYSYRGPENFDGDYELQGSALRLLPSSNVRNRTAPAARDNPLAQAMMNEWQNTFTTVVSPDKSTFSLSGVPYHRQ